MSNKKSQSLCFWQACRVHRVPTLGSYISIFLSVDAVDDLCVCSVYLIWGHQSYFKMQLMLFFFFLMIQRRPLFVFCFNFGVFWNVN